MSQPVLSQDIGSFPFQEVEAVIPDFLDKFRQLPGRQGADLGLRVNLDPEEHLILDDVPRAGENFLI